MERTIHGGFIRKNMFNKMDFDGRVYEAKQRQTSARSSFEKAKRAFPKWQARELAYADLLRIVELSKVRHPQCRVLQGLRRDDTDGRLLLREFALTRRE